MKPLKTILLCAAFICGSPAYAAVSLNYGEPTAVKIGHEQSAQLRRGARPMMRPAVRPMRPSARPVARPLRPISRPVYRPSRPGGVILPAHRPGFRPGISHLHRPYRVRYWRPGIGWAIGTVAAVGVMTAAAAAAYAPSPPAEGMCWFYTDSSYRAGYWGECN